MPNLASVLKSEIQRLAAKEVRQAIEPLKQDKRALKAAIRDLRQRVHQLESEKRALAGELKQSKRLVMEALPAEELNLRVTSSNIKALRRKLKLSQTDFARLLGVSLPTISNWERKSGTLKLRGDHTRKAIYELRGLGVREARRRIEELNAAEARTQPARKARKKS
jgi:DNA-binding transcriptional regulator YiaG